MAGQGSQFTDSSTWSPIVRSIYPEILSSTYSVPPIFFHRVPYQRQIVPGTDYVPGVGHVAGTGLPALVLQQPLAMGDTAPIHDFTPDCLTPMPPSQQPVSSGSQQPVPSASQQPVSSASQQPVPSGSQQPVPSGSQQPVPSGSQQPMSSANQQPMPSTSCGFLNMDPLRDLLSKLPQPQPQGKKQKGGKQKGGKQKKQDLVLTPVQQTDVNDDEAQAQVLRNLQELAEQRKEVMFIISQLNFAEYLSKPGYQVATAKLPEIPKNPKTGLKTEGDYDVLVIHRQRGILLGELKTVGKHPASQNDTAISKTVEKALIQLDKAKAVMHHLVSDVPSPGLRIRTSLFLPYVNTQDLQRILLANAQLEKDACRILDAANAKEAAQLCCCSDQLSDPSTRWDVKPADRQQLEAWWLRRMNQSDVMMNDARYVDVVARFVGPATSVRVNCTTRPRLEVKTVGQAVHELGDQLSTLVLTPDQIDLMQRRDDKTHRLVYLNGPPGTGKTVVLTLVGLCRLRQGQDVHVVSSHDSSNAACSLIEHQLQTTLRSYSTSQSGCGRVFLHHYDLWREEEKDRAVSELTAHGPDLFLIFDELAQPGLGPAHDGPPPRYFPHLLTELRARVTNLRLWAAGIVHSNAPPQLLQIPLTTPLRSAPSILREVQAAITGWWSGAVHPYNNTMFPAAEDGMRVERLVHEVRDINGHTGRAEDCFLCGQNLAALLRRLGVGSELHCSDVLVLSLSMSWLRKDVTDDVNTTTDVCRLVQGIQHSGLAVQVMADPGKDRASWEREVGQVAKATDNSILVTDWNYVQGMERKVVVVLACSPYLIPYFMLFAGSRATTQLVVVGNK